MKIKLIVKYEYLIFIQLILQFPICQKLRSIHIDIVNISSIWMGIIFHKKCTLDSGEY